MNVQSRKTKFEKTLSGFSIERFATTIRADFRFAPINVLLLVALLSQFVSSKLCTFSARLSVATQLFCFVDWLHVK